MEALGAATDIVKKAVTAPGDVTSIPASEIDQTFGSSIDLISAPLSPRIISLSDEWFADASNLLTPTPPIRRPGVFVHSGAWYDGWETRRHNPAAYDFVIIRLGVASGTVKGVEIDTAYFNGNHAPEVSVEGVYSDSDDAVKDVGFGGWESILGRQECGPSQRHAWVLAKETEGKFTHVRLRMYPDGGIARFRLYGTAHPIFPSTLSTVFDLAATQNGGVAISCSDQHFGRKENLLMPGRGKDMGDGWETKRTRGEHVDWVIIRLGARGEIERVVVDTAHFRGNFPQGVRILAGDFTGDPSGEGEEGWMEVLGTQKCGPDKEHEFGREVLQSVEGKAYSHVKMVIIPDGGVKRLRVFGTRWA